MNIGIGYPQNYMDSFLGIGCPADYKITAASQPDYDQWGPDCAWTANDWLTWHKALVAAKGKTEADNTWGAAFDKVQYLGAETFFAVKHPEFKPYVINNGLVGKSQILTQLSKAEKWGNAIQEPFTNLGGAFTNVTSTAESAAKSADTLAKWFPYIVLGAALLIGYLIYKKGSLNVVTA